MWKDVTTVVILLLFSHLAVCVQLKFGCHRTLAILPSGEPPMYGHPVADIDSLPTLPSILSPSTSQIITLCDFGLPLVFPSPSPRGPLTVLLRSNSFIEEILILPPHYVVLLCLQIFAIVDDNLQI